MLWDIDSRLMRATHVFNPFGFVSVRHFAPSGWCAATGTGGGGVDSKAWTPIDALPPWFPDVVTVRVSGPRTSASDLAEVESST